jgi:hypothetical protein
MATPELQGVIFRKVSKPSSNSVFSDDVCMQAARIRGPLLRPDIKNTTNVRSNAIRADNDIMVGRRTILKLNQTGIDIDVFALI